MSTIPPPLPPPTGGVSPELKEMLSFIKEENERYRGYFTNLFEKTLKVAGVVATIFGVAFVFFGISTYHGAKTAASDAAKEVVDAQVRELKPDIDKRIVDGVAGEFATAKLDRLVGNAADQATQRLADPLIRREVEKRVSAAVDGQRHVIDSTLKRAADNAVSQVKDGIQAETDAAVSKIVSSRVEPRLHELTAYNEEVNASALARIGIGSGFDRLYAIIKDNSLPEPLRKTAEADMQIARKEIIRSWPDSVGCDLKRFDSTKESEDLKSENPNVVLEAVNCLEPRLWLDLEPNFLGEPPTYTVPGEAMGKVRKLYPFMDTLYKIATTAPYAWLRLNAFYRLRSYSSLENVTPPDLPLLDNDKLTAWWKAHRADYVR